MSCIMHCILQETTVFKKGKEINNIDLVTVSQFKCTDFFTVDLNIQRCFDEEIWQ